MRSNNIIFGTLAWIMIALVGCNDTTSIDDPMDGSEFDSEALVPRMIDWPGGTYELDLLYSSYGWVFATEVDAYPHDLSWELQAPIYPPGFLNYYGIGSESDLLVAATHFTMLPYNNPLVDYVAMVVYGYAPDDPALELYWQDTAGYPWAPDDTTSPKDTFNIECSPQEGLPYYLRGTVEVTCVASSAAGFEGLQIEDWFFEGADSANKGPISRNNSDTVWSGLMVTNGRIGVRVYDPTLGYFLFSKEIELMDRFWYPESPYGRPQIAVDTTGGTLDSLPKNPANLGVVELVSSLTLSPIRVMDDGPNHGFYYFNAVPLVIWADVTLNYPALRSGSQFWTKHPEERQGTTCSRADVLLQRQLVADHEGTTWQMYSHTWYYRREMEKLVSKLERFSRGIEAEFITDATRLWQEGDSLAKKIANDSTHGSNNPNKPGCNFLWF